ncbi:MAG: hypothetical protein R3301_15815 [Saprospiraceae bacterium]|nr:hypothetical protein [Saprospiraceae bacterium]
MITTLARILLAVAVIVGILWLLQKIRPKPSYFVTDLDYPRQGALETVEVGDFLTLWPSPNGVSIYVYGPRAEMDEDDVMLGQLPSRYFDPVERTLRKGQPYRATVVEHAGSNLRLEVKLNVKELPDELV